MIPELPRPERNPYRNQPLPSIDRLFDSGYRRFSDYGHRCTLPIYAVWALTGRYPTPVTIVQPTNDHTYWVRADPSFPTPRNYGVLNPGDRATASKNYLWVLPALIPREPTLRDLFRHAS